MTPRLTGRDEVDADGGADARDADGAGPGQPGGLEPGVLDGAVSV